jgi:hypothetical protein
MNTALDFSRLNDLSVTMKHVNGIEGGAKIKEVIKTIGKVKKTA